MPIRKLLTRPSSYIGNADVIINWNPLRRCILILTLAAALNTLWLLWKAYVLSSPELHHFVNVELLRSHFKVNLFFLIAFLLLIYPCYKLQQNKTAWIILPPICLSLFAINLCYDVYNIGILSPITPLIAVSTTTVGLLLFNRKVIYTIVCFSLGILSYLMYLTITGWMDYAPLFNAALVQAAPATNIFWVGSMLFFMLPIAFICFFLFDLMMNQWLAREDAFKILSQIDPLTETFNRRSINEYLLDIEKEIRAEKRHYGIILLDLDFFKQINDTYGHLKGDEVLVEVARVLKNNMRYCDIIGRYGGEEFIIIVENTTPSISHQIAQRCRQALMDLDIRSEEGEKIHVTASFGISCMNPETSVQQALHLADVAMYQAKEAGRNSVMVAV